MTTTFKPTQIDEFRRKNHLINGNFDIWQRGTVFSHPITSSPVAAADRWQSGVLVDSGNSPSGTRTTTRRKCTAAEFEHFNAAFYSRLSTDISTLGTTPLYNYDGSAFGVMAIQSMENAAPILGEVVTVSFWARASQPTKIFSESQIHGALSPLFTPTINKIFDITTEWQKYTHTYTMPTYDEVVAYGYNPSAVDVSDPQYTPLGLGSPLGSLGSPLTLPPLETWLYQVDIKNMWSRGTAIGHGNHPNRPAGFPGTAMTDAEIEEIVNSFILNGYYDIAQIQLEVGSTPSSFEFRPYGEELSMCQRYYVKSYAIDVDPGTITGLFNGVEVEEQLAFPTIHNTRVDFPTTMRIAPSVTIYSPVTGAPGNLYFFSDSVGSPVAQDLPVDSVRADQHRLQTIRLVSNSPASGEQSEHYEFHFTANAELF